MFQNIWEQEMMSLSVTFQDSKGQPNGKNFSQLIQARRVMRKIQKVLIIILNQRRKINKEVLDFFSTQLNFIWVVLKRG